MSDQESLPQDSSPDRHHQASDPRDEMAFWARAIRFLEGDLDTAETEAFNAELQGSDEKLGALAEFQVRGAMIRQCMRQTAYEIPDSSLLLMERPRVPWRTYRGLGAMIAASTLMVVSAYFAGRFQQSGQHSSDRPIIAASTEPVDAGFVRLTNSSRARFFGERVPAASSSLIRNHDYVLSDGLIELSFPAGASAIIESPAIFRVVDDTCLAIDVGNCSVHAPTGAEGFRVETPTTRIVDRGTRFMVRVGENAETEVQVIEGLADVYTESVSEVAIRLTHRDARRFPGGNNLQATEVRFTPERYQASLPDRIVCYQAARKHDGGIPDDGVDELQSVTVQRGGRLQRVLAEDLIGVSLTSFRAGPKPNRNGHFAAGTSLPEDRLTLLSDRRLRTGILNPGGSREPLHAVPEFDTPGFSLRFDSPVVNEAGPDVVFFELQCMTNPVVGDAFHVSPLPWSGNRKSHTVGSYDLTLASPEVQLIAGFSLFRCPQPIESLDQLISAECVGGPVRVGFRAIAVGIDLSDLGFDHGETLTELFFQDASDDDSIVDPVFIGGLPPLKPNRNRLDHSP